MTLNEAIAHAKEIAHNAECEECRAEHEQLAEWLEELKNHKHKLFIIGEILVDESKWHITSDKAIENIRKVMQE